MSNQSEEEREQRMRESHSLITPPALNVETPTAGTSTASVDEPLVSPASVDMVSGKVGDPLEEDYEASAEEVASVEDTDPYPDTQSEFTWSDET